MSDDKAKYDGIDILFGNIDVEAELKKIDTTPVSLPQCAPKHTKKKPRPSEDVFDDVAKEITTDKGERGHGPQVED